MTQFSLTPILAYPGLLAAVLLLTPASAQSKTVSTAEPAAKSVKETILPASAGIEAQPILAQVPSVSDLAAPKPQTQSQVTSVSQLSDVQPTDWAFQALQSLVERYGCIAGYPDGTYRGNRALTRYEFAAGLNACLDQVLALMIDDPDPIDLSAIRRLQEEFAAELATLRGRVDALEARTAELEANQFSTTTKLKGEVIFAVADTF
ncbi:MAG: iron uptake porin, partial [Geitlerinemataceae cyanobacterium]